VLQPEDRRCLLEQFLTLDRVFGVLVMKKQSILSVEVGVERNIVIA
jgi:hypothetical protein